MTTPARTRVATLATSVVLAVGLSAAASPALADDAVDTTCVSQTQYDTDVAAAQAAFDAARAAYVTTVKGGSKPGARELKAHRAEVLASVKTHRDELRAMSKELRKARGADKAELRASIAEHKAELRDALKTVNGGMKALVASWLEERKAARDLAKAAFREAEHALGHAELAEVCEEPVVEAPVEEVPADEAPVEETPVDPMA